MTFLRAYIPAAHSWGWSGGAEFNTRIVERQNGRENRNADWSNPRHRFSLGFKHLGKDRYRQLKQHQIVCQGRLRQFLFHDGLDDVATDDLFAVAEVGQQTFQLGCISTIDGVSYPRNVFALYRPNPASPGAAVQVTPEIKVNGTSDSGWAVDHDRGLVTAPAPLTGGEVLTWSGLFSVWVRFESDWLPMSFDEPDGIYGDIGLIEVPPPILIGSPD